MALPACAAGSYSKGTLDLQSDKLPIHMLPASHPLRTQALEVRLRACIGDGRRVLVVGDLNIKPAPADTCHPTPDNESFYAEHWDRRATPCMHRALAAPRNS